MAKGSGTRSGLLWEVERLLDECKELPQVLLMENVPAVIGAKNIQHFAKWQEKLESLGYKNKWQVLNAKDFGIPQNRERCFMVSLLGDYYYEFPKTIPLKLRLKDMLEKEVDEKYYLSSKTIDMFVKHAEKKQAEGCGFKFEPTDASGTAKCISTRSGSRTDDNFIKEVGLKKELCDELIEKGMVEEGDVIRHSYTNDRLNNGVKNMGRTESKDKLCPTLDARCDCLGLTVKDEPKLMQVAQLTDKKYNEMAGRVYSDKGLCPTIRTMQGGGLEPKVAEPIAYDEQNQYLRTDGCCGTLTTDGSSPKHNNRIIEPISKWIENIGTFECSSCGHSAEYISDYCPSCGKKMYYEEVEPIVYDDYNRRIKADQSCIGTLTTNCGNDAERNGVKIIEPCKYELTDKMKRYINSYDDSYKVSDGNLVVNRDIAVAKTTREGSTRADASDYISADIEPNKNIAKMDCTQFRIRKLTPKECWRLMGFADEDVDNAVAVGMSKAQLYKQAGNSIVVNVLMAIFKQML